MPPSPKPTFSLLGKLDHCFASLLLGRDINTNEPLPGFEAGPNFGMTATDKVRCKSIVEQTRLLIVDVMRKPHVEEVRNGETDNDDDADDDLLMDVATVYEDTLTQLGDSL